MNRYTPISHTSAKMHIDKGITCTFVKMTIPLHLPQHIEFHIAGGVHIFSDSYISTHTNIPAKTSSTRMGFYLGTELNLAVGMIYRETTN